MWTDSSPDLISTLLKGLWVHSWPTLYSRHISWLVDQDMKWVSSSVFIDHKCIFQEFYPWCTYLGGAYFIFCVLLLTLLSRPHVCRKHIHDHKGNMLHYEYATWLQGHQSNLKKVYLNSKLDWLSLCVAALHNMA